VAELISYAKAHPGELNFASSGTGAADPSHRGNVQADGGPSIRACAVQRHGIVSARPDRRPGVDVARFDAAPLPHIKSGKLRALAVTSAKRSPVLPDLRRRRGGAARIRVDRALRLFAPAGTPATSLRSSSRSECRAAAAGSPDKLAELGIETSGSTQDALAAIVKSEIAKWAKVIKDGNIKPE